MAVRSPLDLEVKDTFRVTPNMQRVIFAGADLDDFPKRMESGYLKLQFPNTNPNIKKTNLVRTYTIRKFDDKAKELAIDFALHDHTEGPASGWAKQTKTGDRLKMSGPGPVKLVNMQADWFFLVGDMTSLPAISCNLEQMPKDAKGHVVIQVNSKEDCQKLKCPRGVKLDWVINGEPHLPSDALVDAVKSIPLKDGVPSIWVACEFSNMRALRTYFLDTCSISKDQIYISSYWKINANEDQHRVHKSNDAKRQMSIRQRLAMAISIIRRRLGL